METKEFNGKTFYALKGLSGYFATTEGKVLSTHHGTRLLKVSMQGSYHLCKDGKVMNITAARVAYMAQNDCAFEDIPAKYVYMKDGKAYTTNEQGTAKTCKPKIPGKTVIERISFTENELGILRRFYTTQKVKEMCDYIKSKENLLASYAMRTLGRGLTKAKELVQEAVSEFYISLHKGIVCCTIFAYLKKIMRVLAAKEHNFKKHCKEVRGYAFDTLSAKLQ